MFKSSCPLDLLGVMTLSLALHTWLMKHISLSLPHVVLIEVALHTRDSERLKALAVATSPDSHSFRHLLAHAFSNALVASCVQIKYHTEGLGSRDHHSW